MVPDRSLRRHRWELVLRLYRGLEPALVALSAVWIGLVIVELGVGELPRLLEVLVYVIWGLFILEFLVGFTIAPSKRVYLRHRWLTLLSLVLPAFRVLRLAPALRGLRAARVVRPVGLLRIAASLNRGLAALGRTARRRGFGYVVAATGLVIALGSAGMAFLESDDLGDAVAWTAYAMTTGAPSTPDTAEGRLLGWLLSVYGLAVFGYLTAVLASHFVDRDRAVEPVGPGQTPRPGAGTTPDAPR